MRQRIRFLFKDIFYDIALCIVGAISGFAWAGDRIISRKPTV
jgi:hypothetical protein